MHVTPQPEPDCFDESIRKPGNRFLVQEHINPYLPLPPKTELRDYWKKCKIETHKAYDGICAYLGIYLEMVSGSVSIDHYIPKSVLPSLAYEWKNYRLCSSLANSRKREHLDVIDPFYIDDDWFLLDFINGAICPNPDLAPYQMEYAEGTISRLKLDDGDMRKMRLNWWNDYVKREITQHFLERKAPFIYKEALRQGLL